MKPAAYLFVSIIVFTLASLPFLSGCQGNGLKTQAPASTSDSAAQPENGSSGVNPSPIDNSKDSDEQSAEIDLLDEQHLATWKAAKFGGQGKTSIARDKIELGFGYNMTGVVYDGELPNDHYRVSYEARRTEGSDFFGTLTFPVKDSHCSLVLGGWAGATVGLSSIDNEDASRNETKILMGFTRQQWYEVVVEVDYPMIKCWIDDKLVIEVDVTGKSLSVRGDVEVCRPLGFCSFETEAEIRNVKLQHLVSDEKP